MRLSADVGGTFTDLVVEHEDGRLELFKSPTTPDDPATGVFDVLHLAAGASGVSLERLLGGCALFMHATTRATNAVLTGSAGRVAFLTTRGHPDILLLREGGRVDPFDNTVPFPEPLVPRALTFELRERIRADGTVHEALDEAAAREVIAGLGAAGAGVEAVGVCLLWSIVNPVHEERVGELLEALLPGVPYTLSHRLNPSLRGVPARIQHLHRRFAQAADERLSLVHRGAPARGGLRRAPSRGHVAGQRDGRGGPGRRAHPLDQLRTLDGSGGRRALRPRRRRRPDRHRRRHRGHQLRREPSAQRAHSLDAGDLAGAPPARKHDRLPLGRRAQRRRRGRQHRPGGRGRDAPRRPGKRGRRARPGVLRPGRRPPHPERRRARARLHRSRLLPRRFHPARCPRRARRRPAVPRRAPGPRGGGRRDRRARGREREPWCTPSRTSP